MASFLCSHESYILPSAQPIANTNIYPYKCERCVRREAEEAVKKIERDNKARKNKLDDIIDKNMRLRDEDPNFPIHPHMEEILMEVNEMVLERDELKEKEPEQISEAWKLYKKLYEGGAEYPLSNEVFEGSRGREDLNGTEWR